MKKRFTMLFTALAAVVAMAVPSFAAPGLNSNEQALLNHFSSVVYSHDSIMQHPQGYPQSDQYIAEATNALIQVDLDAAACADLDEAITEVDIILTGNGVTTPAQARFILPTVLARVNATANKYGMDVSVVDARGTAADGIATVTITVAPSPKSDSSSSDSSSKSSSSSTGVKTTVASTGKVVKQTGFDMTATMVMAGIMFAAFAGGVAVVCKKRYLAK